MRILITGGCGQIGTNLCLRLLGEGQEVVAVDNFITGDRGNLTTLRNYPNFTFLERDIEDLELKNDLALYKIDEIYHLACPTGVPNLVTLAEEMLSATSVGTRNILEIALEKKAPVLIASSSEVYGEPQVPLQSESYTGNVLPTGVRSPYEEGKRFTESLAMMFFRKYGLDVKIARIFNTYGSHKSRKDLRVIPQFTEQALVGGPLTVHGRGEQKRTFLHVEDLIDGLFLILRKGKKAEVYNIGSDKEMTILDLAKLILKATGSKSEIKFVERPSHDHHFRLPDLTKIKGLGWEPKISLEEGISRTISEPQPANS
jgi:nucleoside-diphosphate-sugar epimerase